VFYVWHWKNATLIRCLQLNPEKLARRYELIPIAQKDGVLRVAMSDPLNVLPLMILRIIQV